MANSITPTVANLKRAIEIAEQIEKLQAQLAALVGGNSVAVASSQPAAPAPAGPGRRKSGKRQLSPEARDRIAAAQRARWAKVRGKSKNTKSVTPSAPAPKKEGKKKKRVLTTAGRAKLSAALKARWAARKKGAPAPNAPKK